MTTTIIGIVAAVFAALLGLVKIAFSQRDSAREERDQATRNYEIVKSRAEKAAELAKKQTEVQQESYAHEQAIAENTIDAPPDTEFFGDSRLRRENDK